jgi:hypothetical protein
MATSSTKYAATGKLFPPFDPTADAFLPSKKEIPQHNYVMHTAHCARNITLCHVCREPIPKNQFEAHKKSCVAVKPKTKKSEPPPVNLERSQYYQDRKAIENKKVAARKERQMQKYDRLVDTGYSLQSQKVATEALQQKQSEKPKSNLLACKFCDLELPKLELEEHENYCGTRTDKCLECGELVMFKYKQIHMDSNHGFLKLKDGKFCRLFKLAAQTLYVDWSVQTKMNKILLLGIKMELSKYWYYQNVTFRYYLVYVK